MGSSLSHQSAYDAITDWHSKPAHELIFDSSHREISQYMRAVDKIQQSAKTKGNDELLTAAMARLKCEFQTVLSRQADYAAGPSSVTEWSSVIDSTANAIRIEDYEDHKAPNTQVILYLRNIAERMSLCGNLEDCIQGYKIVRKSFLQSQLKRLHFEELSLGENSRRFKWDELQMKIELWIQASKICIQIFFEREKKLCQEIFQDLGDNAAKDKCFVGTVQDIAVSLFGFAKAVSLSNQSYDRMEGILGLYSAFWLALEISNPLFLSESGKNIRNFCSETLSKIESDVQRLLHDFENAVLREIWNDSDNNGSIHSSSIHSSTKYVMKQIDVIVRNKTLLTNLVKSTPSLNFGDLTIHKEELGDFDFRTFLELHLILIIVILQKNLEDKSKHCKNPILGHLFMMNNIKYIIQKIQGSNYLQEMIGEFYLNKLNQNLKVAKTSYQTSTCKKFLICFEDDGLHVTQCFCSRLSKTGLKGRMKAFNDVFEEIKASQTSWAVPDLVLREEIRQSLSRTLVPAYRNFLEKFRSNVAIDKKGIAHSAEDLEDLILRKLFSPTNEDTV